VFLHRSPLSPYIHDEDQHAKATMDQLRETAIVSVIYCWSDSIRQRERLGERDYWATSEEREIFNVLKETDEDHLLALQEKYESHTKTEFDASLPTTSAKQATANLLTLCGIDFDPVFDLNRLEKHCTTRPSTLGKL